MIYSGKNLIIICVHCDWLGLFPCAFTWRIEGNLNIFLICHLAWIVGNCDNCILSEITCNCFSATVQKFKWISITHRFSCWRAGKTGCYWRYINRNIAGSIRHRHRVSRNINLRPITQHLGVSVWNGECIGNRFRQWIGLFKNRQSFTCYCLSPTR